MKIYKVKVNGKVYEVELESVSENNATISAPAAAPATTASAPVSNGAATILAPIAGKVIDIKVKVGDFVKKGQVVAIIEAMKLMNEIIAEEDVKIEKVLVRDGQLVEYGSQLFRISK